MKIDMLLARQAERSILGALMISGEAAAHMKRLAPADFINQTNGKIFAAMQGLRDAGKPIDLVTLHDAISENGIDIGENGLEYLIDLGKEVPSGVNAEQYAAIVARNGMEHRLNEAMARIIKGEDSAMDALETVLAREKAKANTGAVGSAQMVMDYMEALVEEPEMSMFFTGIPKVDRNMGGLPRGSVSVIAARPRIGKTTMAINFMVHNIRRERKAAFFSLEMTTRQILDRVSALVAWVPYSAVHGRRLDDAEKTKICNELPELVTADRLNVMDNTRSVSAIVDEIDRLRPDIVFIDYIQRIKAARHSDNRSYEIEDILYRLKEAAVRYNCHICVLSQIGRGGAKQPTLEDLKGSGAIEEAGDIIMLLHRDNDPGTIEPGIHGVLAVAKHKYGQTGTVDLVFDGVHQRFTQEARVN